MISTTGCKIIGTQCFQNMLSTAPGEINKSKLISSIVNRDLEIRNCPLWNCSSCSLQNLQTQMGHCNNKFKLHNFIFIYRNWNSNLESQSPYLIDLSANEKFSRFTWILAYSSVETVTVTSFLVLTTSFAFLSTRSLNEKVERRNFTVMLLDKP